MERRSRTLTAGQLMEQLSRLDPDLPVVFEARDEPLGNYGVRAVEVDEQQRESLFADGPYGCDVFHEKIGGGYNGHPAEWWTGDRYDQPGPVVFLRYELPWQPTIDGELAQPELEAPA